MIVADTSAWIEFFRGGGHPSGLALEKLIQRDADLGVTEVVVAEVLAGARSDEHARQLRARLLAFPMLVLEGLADYEEAALLSRVLRKAGETRGTITDFLIALPVMRAKASLLHNDRNFDAIARHSSLRIYRAA